MRANPMLSSLDITRKIVGNVMLCTNKVRYDYGNCQDFVLVGSGIYDFLMCYDSFSHTENVGKINPMLCGYLKGISIYLDTGNVNDEFDIEAFTSENSLREKYIAIYRNEKIKELLN